MADHPDIIASGHLCLDLLPKMEHINPEALISPGKLFEVGSLDMSTGGSVSNTGLALQRLGANVGLMSGVGDDLLGQVILAFLNKRDPSLTRTIRVKQGEKSSYTVVLSPNRMDRIFLHCTGTNTTFDSHDIDYKVLENAKIFHLGYPPLLPRLYEDDGSELERIFVQAKQAGVITSLDMSLPDRTSASGQANWRRIVERVLPYVDIFVPSIEEALFMLRRQETEEKGIPWNQYVTVDYLRGLADEVFEIGHSALVGFKLSEYGVYLRTGNADDLGSRLNRLYGKESKSPLTPNTEIYQPAFHVNAVGTTGAGDSAYGALLTALTKGLDLESCAKWMCAVGACNVEAADATSGVRSWDETAQRINLGWDFSDIRLPTG